MSRSPDRYLTAHGVMLFKDKDGNVVEVEPGSLAEAGYPIDPETGDDLEYLGLALDDHMPEPTGWVSVLQALIAAWEDKTETNMEDRITAIVEDAKMMLPVPASGSDGWPRYSVRKVSDLPVAHLSPGGMVLCPRCNRTITQLTDWVPRQFDLKDNDGWLMASDQEMCWDACTETVAYCEKCDAEAQLPSEVRERLDYV